MASTSTTGSSSSSSSSSPINNTNATSLKQAYATVPMLSPPCLPDDHAREDVSSAGTFSSLHSWLDLNPMNPLFAPATATATADARSDGGSTDTSDRSSIASEELVRLSDWAAAAISCVIQNEKRLLAEGQSNAAACTPSPALSDTSSKQSPLASPPAFSDALFIPNTADDGNDVAPAAPSMPGARGASHLREYYALADQRPLTVPAAFAPHTPPLLDMPCATAAATQALFAGLPAHEPSVAMTAADAMALMASLPLLFPQQQQQQQQPMQKDTTTGLHTPAGGCSPLAPSTTGQPSSSNPRSPIHGKAVPSIQRPVPARLQLDGISDFLVMDSPLLTPTDEHDTESTAQPASRPATANPRKRSRDDIECTVPPHPSPSMAQARLAQSSATSSSAASLPLIAPATSEHPATSSSSSSQGSLDDQRPRRQRPRFPGDLYTPSWVRYAGQAKEGCCEDCKPNKWLQLKNSAYWYHKQFYHGISSVSGRPFIAPLETRIRDRDMIEGLCHHCRTWVPVASHRRRNCVLWYRHAHKCHVYQRPRTASAEQLNTATAATAILPPSVQPQLPMMPAAQLLAMSYPRHASASSLPSLIFPAAMGIAPATATSANTAAPSSLRLY